MEHRTHSFYAKNRHGLKQEMLLLSGQQLVAVLERRHQGTGLFSVRKLGSKSGEDGWVLLEDEVISVMIPLSTVV